MSQNLIITNENGKLGIIDQNGKLICKPIYDHIRYVGRYDSFIVKKDGKYGLLGNDGAMLADTKYQHIAPYKIDPYDNNMDNGYEITQDTGIGWLSLEGKEILSPVYKNFKRIGNLLVVENLKTRRESFYSIDGKKLNESKDLYLFKVNNDYIKVEDQEKKKNICLIKMVIYISSIKKRCLFINLFQISLLLQGMIVVKNGVL